jgi:hypothetical protein
VIVFGLVFGAAIFGMFLGRNLRVLEQKVNASDPPSPRLLRKLSRAGGVPSKLSEADKFDLQLRKRSVAPTELYALTRCYGSLTTFNILFKNKDDHFRTGAADRPTG